MCVDICKCYFVLAVYNCNRTHAVVSCILVCVWICVADVCFTVSIFHLDAFIQHQWQTWPQTWPDWTQMGQITHFFTSDFTTWKTPRICPIWGQSEPLWAQIWSRVSKGQDTGCLILIPWKIQISLICLENTDFTNIMSMCSFSMW